MTQSLKAEFTVHREAAFKNFVGFDKIAEENGGIDTNNDGRADILLDKSVTPKPPCVKRVTGIDLTVDNQGMKLHWHFRV